MRFRLGVLVASVAAGALWFPTAAGATSTHAAPTVTCGMVVSTSITLTHDLNCPGTALSVQNDGSAPIALTIDLGRHTVSSASGAAIEARDKSVTMTLQNGRIAGSATNQSVEDEGRSNVYQHLIFDRGSIVSVNDAAPRILHSWFVHGAFVFTDQNSADIEHNVFTAEGRSSRFDPNSGALRLFSTH